MPRWIKLRPAAEYSGIGMKRLVRLAESGEIKGFKDPDSGRQDWVFDVVSIDQYRENQYRAASNIEKIALDILGSLCSK